MRSLALTYRPRRFADVVGQNHVTVVLRALCDRDALPTSLVFAGSHGTGKTTAARIFAASVLCDEAVEGDACGECDSCCEVQQGSNPNVIEVDAASNGGVAEVSRIQELLLYSHGSATVVILDEAQSMSREANNALLKTLEEPPDGVCFLLLTTEPDKLLPTVRSRSMSFDFRPIPLEAVVGRLQAVCEAEGKEVDTDVLTVLAKRSGGHLREALVLLEQCLAVSVSTLSEYVDVFGVSDPSYDIIRCVAHGDLEAALNLTEKFFQSSGDGKLFADQIVQSLLTLSRAAVGGDATHDYVALSQIVPRPAILSALHVMWDFTDRARHVTTDDRMTADLAVVMLVKVMGQNVGAGSPAPILKAEPEDVLDVSEAFDYLREEGLLQADG